MISQLFLVAPLLASFAILCIGHGLQSVLLPARGAMFELYPNMTTGAMMSAYCAGFIAGTFLCPRLISRVGHIRVFAAAAAITSAVMLCHALTEHPWAWIALRAVYGLCFVHLYMVMESWLNSVGETRIRGRILSVYMIINFLAMSAGNLLFFTAPASGFELFSLSAMLLSLSLVPLILSRSSQPVDLQPAEFFGIRKLFQVSPLGVIGALVSGLMGGAYWGLAAVYVLRMGFAQEHIASFMAAGLMGGLLAQWPLGSLSDRVNRRYVILLASVIVSLSAAVLVLMALWQTPAEAFGIGWLILVGLIFGAGFHPLYSLCIAHTNDFVAAEHFVRASAGLQLINGIGAIAGPLFAGILMYLGGYIMLFVYIGILTGLFAVYTLLRLTGNRRPPVETVAPFRMLTRTGLFVFRMDPRYRNGRYDRR